MNRQDADRKPFLGFALDRETLEAIVNAIKGLGWGPQNVLYGDIDMAVANLRDAPTPHRVVVDLTGCDDPLNELNGLAEVCDEGTTVIAIGQENDLNLYRQLKDAGVKEYLLKPVDPDQLNAALKTRHSERDENESAWANRVLTVIGASGGVGTTSVATSLAWMYAHKEQKKTALIELDPWFGTAAFSLGLEANPGLMDALQDPNRIDSLFVQRAMSVHSERLSVLASEPDLRSPPALNPNAASVLIQRLAPEFDRVVIDLPRCNAGYLASALSQSSRLLMVSDLSMASVRDCVRIAELAESVSPNLEMGVVLNRIGDKGRDALNTKQFEKTVNRPILAVLPETPKALAAAAASGKAVPEAAANSPFVKAMAKQWEALTGAPHQRDSGSLWNRLKHLRGNQASKVSTEVRV